MPYCCCQVFTNQYKNHNKLGKQKYITKYQNDKCQAAFNAIRFMYSISFFHLMSKTPAAVNFINIYD